MQYISEFVMVVTAMTLKNTMMIVTTIMMIEIRTTL